jgi:hypothetical protein
MNGLDLLIGMAIVSSVAFILGKISLLKQDRQFWKDSCFIAMEKYNNLLVEKQMGETIKKVFDTKSLDVN